MLKNAKQFNELLNIIETELAGLPTYNDIGGDNQSIIDYMGTGRQFVELDRNFDEDGQDYYSHIRVCLNDYYYHCAFTSNGINCYVHQLEYVGYWKIVNSEICTYDKFLSILNQFLETYGENLKLAG